MVMPNSCLCLDTLTKDLNYDARCVATDMIISGVIKAVLNANGMEDGEIVYEYSDKRISFSGPFGKECKALLHYLLLQAAKSELSSEREILDLLLNYTEGQASNEIMFRTPGLVVFGKTDNQKIYMRNVESSDISFGIGPAGTGKTYLAVAKAVECLLAGEVKRIIVTRPPVESGETVGFLPGSEKEKLDPYMVPITDALEEMLGRKKLEEMIAERVIEINHIGYFRGRTFKGDFVILDEGQNCTKEQGRMIITRLGEGSRMIINGDLEQVDIRGFNALAYALEVFDVYGSIPDGISVSHFDESDCLRHPTVANFLIADKAHREWLAEKAANESADQ